MMQHCTVASLRGEAVIPGDKSITHRALILAALAEGSSHIKGFLPCEDCLATIACLRRLGVEIERSNELSLRVVGEGLSRFRPTEAPVHLDCRRSGTAMRLLAGTLAGQRVHATLLGEPQLLRRPMGRVVEPLRKMGALIEDTDGKAPLRIEGRALHGIEHQLAVPSAQVKSAILLAGLTAAGITRITQGAPTRDHTERMLRRMGAPVVVNETTSEVSIHNTRSLRPLSISVPGDLSSAAFLLAGALISPDSDVKLHRVGINPTRTGLLDVLRAMGADIEIITDAPEAFGNEPTATIRARSSALRGVTIGGELIPRMIDELPVLALLATQALGTTIVRNAGELRFKETDRIATVVNELRALGAAITATDDGFVVEGPTPLHGANVSDHGDHRLAMMLAIASLITSGNRPIVSGDDRTHDSFPGFFTMLEKLKAPLTRTQQRRKVIR